MGLVQWGISYTPNSNSQAKYDKQGDWMGHHKTPTKEAAELSSYSKRHMVKTGQKMGHHSVQILFKFCSNISFFGPSIDSNWLLHTQTANLHSFFLTQYTLVFFAFPNLLPLHQDAAKWCHQRGHGWWWWPWPTPATSQRSFSQESAGFRLKPLVFLMNPPNRPRVQEKLPLDGIYIYIYVYLLIP